MSTTQTDVIPPCNYRRKVCVGGGVGTPWTKKRSARMVSRGPGVLGHRAHRDMARCHKLPAKSSKSLIHTKKDIVSLDVIIGPHPPSQRAPRGLGPSENAPGTHRPPFEWSGDVASFESQTPRSANWQAHQASPLLSRGTPSSVTGSAGSQRPAGSARVIAPLAWLRLVGQYHCDSLSAWTHGWLGISCGHHRGSRLRRSLRIGGGMGLPAHRASWHSDRCRTGHVAIHRHDGYPMDGNTMARCCCRRRVDGSHRSVCTGALRHAVPTGRKAERSGHPGRRPPHRRWAASRRGHRQETRHVLARMAC